jgi:hypothetical protein
MNTPDDPPSPYQPPRAELTLAPAELPTLAPHERSEAPKVFGVLSIIFASIVLLCSSMGLLASAASKAVQNMGSLASPDPEKAAEVSAMMHPLAKVYQGIGLQSLILFVMSGLLLAIGIGQVRYRRWARRWSVYWGAAGLVCVALMVAISLLIISPAYGAFFDSLSRMDPGEGHAPMPPSMGAMSSFFGGTFAVLSVILYTPYPALLLLFFTREHVRASMTR